MISVKTNISSVVLKLQTKLSAMADKDKMLRACAVGILPVIKTRIHEQGKDATGNQIGLYSDAYMKVRTGNYGNSARFSKGKNKGKTKDSGFYTKKGIRTPFGKSSIAFQNIESDKISRPNYRRNNDRKVIASLTRQMENDFSVIPTETGYGLGYNNPTNRLKVDYVEETYKKKIFSTTKEENSLIVEIATDYIAQS